MIRRRSLPCRRRFDRSWCANWRSPTRATAPVDEVNSFDPQTDAEADGVALAGRRRPAAQGGAAAGVGILERPASAHDAALRHLLAAGVERDPRRTDLVEVGPVLVGGPIADVAV